MLSANLIIEKGVSGKSSRKSNSWRGSRTSSSKTSSVGRAESKASRDSQIKDEEEALQKESSEGLSKSGEDEATEATESEATLKEKKTKFITEIRIEEEQYIETVIHIAEKKIPEEFETAPCVFFLRNLETKLPGKKRFRQAFTIGIGIDTRPIQFQSRPLPAPLRYIQISGVKRM